MSYISTKLRGLTILNIPEKKSRRCYKLAHISLPHENATDEVPGISHVYCNLIEVNNMAEEAQDLDTGRVKEWRSIITLVVFVITKYALTSAIFSDIIVLFPFRVPVYIPRPIWNRVVDSLTALRIIPERQDKSHRFRRRDSLMSNGQPKRFFRTSFPMNMFTAPLIADLFLLAIRAIGRQEVHDGTVGAQGISPIDIMVFFLSLAYIAISIDASGVIRWLAFKVLQKAGKNGHLLFVYLYTFFFLLTSFVGNDPIVLSGTPFLSYMTRVSSNIKHPRAWIFMQFAVANIGSAILVSSNPTNLVLASAFEIKFIHYTANVVVPVVATAILLLPFFLYVVFRSEDLVPRSVKLHELPERYKQKAPVNPNIPNARGPIEDDEIAALEEILNPFLDKPSAWFAGAVMAATLITILAINASSGGHEYPVFWITLPAAFVVFCWDLTRGWLNREDTRRQARLGQEAIEHAQESHMSSAIDAGSEKAGLFTPDANDKSLEAIASPAVNKGEVASLPQSATGETGTLPNAADEEVHTKPGYVQELVVPSKGLNEVSGTIELSGRAGAKPKPKSLMELIATFFAWCQVTFPTITTVASHLPWTLVPFAFCMFVLVQALVTKGWVPVFAHGWDHWIDRTGIVGAIGGMGFLSVVLCNFAGTNIGTTILLSRVIQAWVAIHKQNDTTVSQRMFWATVYSMAIGVNYGAFSTTFSASLAGLLWRSILSRKDIRVGSLEFARVNVLIITFTTVVGLAILIGQIYITRTSKLFGKHLVVLSPGPIPALPATAQNMHFNFLSFFPAPPDLPPRTFVLPSQPHSKSPLYKDGWRNRSPYTTHRCHEGCHTRLKLLQSIMIARRHFTPWQIFRIAELFGTACTACMDA
ncbi:uncharacterized protein MYCFIDRAFT_208366 [Pseudocercospora fijiensis CIRAD86]|uniref:Citrate transporter-like domain-containing protein n=1 Tax=Pseudocercospora fijiensis (strain CIRAD86) TaxID=383855 RepID=M2ZQZ3_PSEFD|nr:uncharacterized protein MYCFIDRAFT_208366 [Pseudocercospora fijiensis CIRAD86]EME81494.1 hypothetical protein MYCFIDRAFT_208366 [Pseudocercospora fijiensis CIRAD86]